MRNISSRVALAEFASRKTAIISFTMSAGVKRRMLLQCAIIANANID